MTTLLLPKPNLTAPYAPFSNALDTLNQIRERGLPNPVTAQVIERIGIPLGNVPRTIALLKYLGITDDKGHLTEKYERLKRARSEDYQGVLAEIITEGYGDVFDYINPETASVEAIEDAFRHHEPSAQRKRMVTLFIGLCEEAGIRPLGQRVSSKPLSQRASSNDSRKSRPRSNSRGSTPATRIANKPAQEDVGLASDYALLIALFQQLPADKKWTEKQRERWLTLFEANLDYLVEVIREPA